MTTRVDEVRQVVGYVERPAGWTVYYDLDGQRFYEAAAWSTRDEAADAAEATRDRLTTWQVGAGRVVCFDNIDRTFALRCRAHPLASVFTGALAGAEPLVWDHGHVTCGDAR